MLCSARTDKVEGMEKLNGKAGLSISRKNTEYLWCNNHNYSTSRLQDKTVESVKSEREGGGVKC